MQMIPYPENKPADYGRYKVQLTDGTTPVLAFNGCGWVNYTDESKVIAFNPMNLHSSVQIWTFDKVTKQLIKI